MSRPRLPSRARLILSLLLLVSLLPAVGCNGDWSLRGMVTVDGELVGGGTVYFTHWYDNVDPDGTTHRDPDVTSATIGSDGSYNVMLKYGYDYTITLTNANAPLPGSIPDRYAQDTGLSLTAGNSSTFDIALTR